MQERRNTSRKKIKYYVPVIDAESYEQIGVLLEITSQGMMVDSQKLVPIDRPIRLRLDLTDQSFEVPFISFVAQAKWVRPDKIEPNYFDVGFEIVEISDEDRLIVEEIMEKYASQSAS